MYWVQFSDKLLYDCNLQMLSIAYSYTIYYKRLNFNEHLKKKIQIKV